MERNCATAATTEEDRPTSRAFVSRNLERHLLHRAQRCAWRLLAHDLPPWKTVYTYFRRWRKDGTWERLNTALREAVREKQSVTRDPVPPFWTANRSRLWKAAISAAMMPARKSQDASGI